MKKKKNYDQLANQILELVGGRENITFFAHCMTRLRFNVKDKGLVNIEQIENLEDLVGCQWSGDQFQIIVGDAVNSVYDVICVIGGFQVESVVDENLDGQKSEKLTLKQIPNRIIETLSACMSPLLPLLIAVGLFSALYSIIGPSCLNLVSEDSDFYQLFYNVAQAGIFFLPVAVTITASKRFGCNTMSVLLIIFVTLYPSFTTILMGGNFTVFSIPVTPTMYSGQIIPAILICWIMSYVERIFKRILPEVLKTTLLSVITVIIMLPISLCILAPAGYFIGTGISNVLIGAYNIAGPLGTALVGLCWMPLIVGGMHMPLGMLASVTFIAQGVEYTVLPISLATVFLAATANVAVLLKTKSKKEKELSVSGLVSILLGGVVEPSLYGIYLKHKKVLVSYLIGHMVAGFIIGLLQVGYYVPTASNFLSILGYLGPEMSNLINAVIAIVVGAIVVFILIMILGIDDKKKLS